MPRVTRSQTSGAQVTVENAETQQLSSPPETPASTNTRKRQLKTPTAPKANEARSRDPPLTPASNNRKRSRKPIKQEDPFVDELPHNLGTVLGDEGPESRSPPSKRLKRTAKVEDGLGAEIKTEEGHEISRTPKTAKSPKKKNYGLMPGLTPFPDHHHPTPEECHEIVRLLEKAHGAVKVPAKVPPPSVTVAGCGEVPSVLDALVRTRLSANTTNKNSSTAFKGLASRFGILKEGIGKGSVDWDAVRLAPQPDVQEAIKHGGLAKIKSKDIQTMIQMAWEENQARKESLKSPSDNPPGADNEPESMKQEEIAKAEANVIDMQYFHQLSTEDAMLKMVEFPGIGVKTASCVALFCLRRPSFAVDTHIFRLCQYLGWVPRTTKKGQPKVDRDTTFSHCDALIPNEFNLKYKLHYLLIKHGKECPRCRAATSTTSAKWEDGCPIEHLVKRHGTKKGGISTADRKAAEKAAGLPDDVAEADELDDVAAENEEDSDE